MSDFIQRTFPLMSRRDGHRDAIKLVGEQHILFLMSSICTAFCKSDGDCEVSLLKHAFGLEIHVRTAAKKCV